GSLPSVNAASPALPRSIVPAINSTFAFDAASLLDGDAMRSNRNGGMEVLRSIVIVTSAFAEQATRIAAMTNFTEANGNSLGARASRALFLAKSCLTAGGTPALP